ncbi:hypothetical protein BROUX41_006201 [Berkeleyomyces rouxiae]|uniref:uncharacterized protein n=1 Tax=Berkeleyomyces rouxiae TaxID=2035830 RepID=UPI003B78BB71
MGSNRQGDSRVPRSPRRGHRSRTRSRSPRHDDKHRSSHRSHRTRDDRSRERIRDDGRHNERKHHRQQSDSSAATSRVIELPFSARPIHKREFKAFLPLLAYYLDLQKQKDLSVMDEREAKGRWKSFLGKWNKGELAEGWYDPSMFERSKELYGEDPWFFEKDTELEKAGGVELKGRAESHDDEGVNVPSVLEKTYIPYASDSDSDDIGPAPPPIHRTISTPHGAAVPSISDLAMRDQTRLEDRQDSIDNLRHERKQDRVLQKQRLEELLPCADPGSRERKLEKKAEVREKLRAVSPGGGAPEHDDNDLIGGGDSLAEMKRIKDNVQRKKTEREKRREEIWRAREAEREERVREYREKEDATVRMLQEFARNRGGAGGF